MITERDLIHPNERKYFLLALIASLLTYLFLIISITGIIFLVFFLGITLFAHGLMLAYIRTNGVKLSSTQFPAIYNKTLILAEQMGMTSFPDIYVLQSGGALNAFATKFFGRNMVVLYSEVFELIKQGAEDELAFIIAHELAHIKRRHLTKQMLILPALWIPLLGEAYSRSCEYTCDRIGAFYTGNLQASKNSLVILAVGRGLYKDVQQQEFIEQIATENGFFIWLSQKTSTHPPLPKRINELGSLENGDFLTQKGSKSWMIAALFLLLFSIGLGYSIKTTLASIDFSKLSLTNGQFLTAPSSDDSTPLIKAVTEKNNDQVRSLIAQGEHVDQTDSYGWTALFWAIEDQNLEAVQELINARADVNHLDYDMISPLMLAASHDNTEILELLISHGAALNEQDIDEYTPLIYAVINDQSKAVELLLASGADPQMKSYEDLTPLMYAIKIGNPDVIKLLR